MSGSLKQLRERTDRSEAGASPSSLLRVGVAIRRSRIHDEQRRRRRSLLDVLGRWSGLAGGRPLAGRGAPRSPTASGAGPPTTASDGPRGDSLSEGGA